MESGDAHFSFQVNASKVSKGKAGKGKSSKSGKGNPVSGQLDYHDDVTGLDFKSKVITSLVVNGTHGRFSGIAILATGNRLGFVVDIDDLGEPGIGTDQFSIGLTDGYTASGTLDTGNIQIHSSKGRK